MSITPIPTPSDPGLQQQVEAARQDLARNLGASPDEIVLVELEAVVWPDSSLGCPQPGMAYAQVQIEGLRIRLLAGERVYSYHSGGGEPPFLCVQPAAGGTAP